MSKKTESKNALPPPPENPTSSNHEQMADLLRQIKLGDTHHQSERQRLLAEFEAEKGAPK